MPTAQECISTILVKAKHIESSRNPATKKYILGMRMAVAVIRDLIAEDSSAATPDGSGPEPGSPQD